MTEKNKTAQKEYLTWFFMQFSNYLNSVYKTSNSYNPIVLYNTSKEN